MPNQIKLQYIHNMIKENQLEYITRKSIQEFDFNRLSLIFAIATNNAYSFSEIREYIEEYSPIEIQE